MATIVWVAGIAKQPSLHEMYPVRVTIFHRASQELIT